MIEAVRRAGAQPERPCRVLMDIVGPKRRILRVKAPPKTRRLRGDRVVLIDKLDEKTKEPIAFSLNFPELIDQLEVGSELFIDDGKAAGRMICKTADRAEIKISAASEMGIRPKPGKGVEFSRPNSICRPRFHRPTRRPDRLLVRTEGRRHRTPAGSSHRAPPQARAAGACVEDRDAARGAQSAAAHSAIGGAQFYGGHDCSRRSRSRARLRAAHRNAAGDPVALRGGAYARRLGDPGARQLLSTACEPRRNDRCGHGASAPNASCSTRGRISPRAWRSCVMC